MAERVRKARRAEQKASTEETAENAKTDAETRAEKLKAIDEVLADIDDVLEQEAELFVREFVQKGGQ